jgi:hypothetical protein
MLNCQNPLLSYRERRRDIKCTVTVQHSAQYTVTVQRSAQYTVTVQRSAQYTVTVQCSAQYTVHCNCTMQCAVPCIIALFNVGNVSLCAWVLYGVDIHILKEEILFYTVSVRLTQAAATVHAPVSVRLTQAAAASVHAPPPLCHLHALST